MKIAYFDCFSGAAGDMIVGACLDAGAPVEYLRTELDKLALAEVRLRIEKVNKKGIAATAFEPIIDYSDHHQSDHSHLGHNLAGHDQADHDQADHGHSSHNQADYDQFSHDHFGQEQSSHERPDDHHHPDGHHHNNGHNRNFGHHHSPGQGRNLAAITEIIKGAGLAGSAAPKAIAIFDNLARAEAKVHGTNLQSVHFHEVGAADAIVDIVGACVCLESLGIERVFCSSPAVGGGTVECAHGTMPVPAPATAELIKGIEIAPAPAQAELLTPTGAAILTTLAHRFGPMPAMRINSIGYGAGRRDLPGVPNVLRLLVGETTGTEPDTTVSDEVVILEANIDDATGELIGYVAERLREKGALDVYCTAISMKQNRPATQISIICRPDKAAELERLLFIESTTLGVRRHTCRRNILSRAHQTVQTPFGQIRIKTGSYDGKIVTSSPEFSDCQQAAGQHDVTVKQVIAAALAAYRSVGDE